MRHGAVDHRHARHAAALLETAGTSAAKTVGVARVQEGRQTAINEVIRGWGIGMHHAGTQRGAETPYQRPGRTVCSQNSSRPRPPAGLRRDGHMALDRLKVAPAVNFPHIQTTFAPPLTRLPSAHDRFQ